MASFAQFLGRRVTVQYRIGDVVLDASGIFSADSGRSIFLEQHIEQKGKRSYFRWEIPYRSIHAIEESPAEAGDEDETSTQTPEQRPVVPVAARATAAGSTAAGSTAASFLPLSQPPKLV